jgi:hypothetical protein
MRDSGGAVFAARCETKRRWVPPALDSGGRARRLASTSGDLTDLGYPDCRGVLAVREEGRLKHLSFRCSVGDGYSGEA